jgi:hypothetical protein
MRSPTSAGSRFLVIVVQSLPPGILSVEGDPVPISNACESPDHESPQKEKENRKKTKKEICKK